MYRSHLPFKYASGFFVMLLLMGVFVGSARAAYALSNFQFDSTTKSVKMGESLEVPVRISTDADSAVSSADLWMLFDTSMFDITNVADEGGFFADTTNQLVGSKLYVSGFFEDATTTNSGEGLFATVYLTPKKTGTSNLTFDCRGNDFADTSKINVNPQNPQNIIDCSSTQNAKLTITVTDDSGATEATPTPEAAAGGTTGSTDGTAVIYESSDSVTTPTVLPETGYFDTTLWYIVTGGLFIGVGGILRKLYI